jgi:predicted site-specific integrase-resolvase
MSTNMLRPKKAWTKLGVGRTTFYEDFVKTGRVKLYALGPKARAAREDELDQLIASLPEAEQVPVARKRNTKTRRPLNDRA